MSPGVYPESIDFAGKAIVILGDPADPTNVVIDGTGLNSAVVRASSGETAGSVLRGVTIRDGVVGDLIDDDTRAGGGLFVSNASPVIEDCHFVDNASALGGGAYAKDTGLVVRRCIFRDNAAAIGGGIVIEGGVEARVEDCLFETNRTTGTGGGMYVLAGEGSLGTIVLGTILKANESGERGGGLSWDSTTGTSSLRLEGCSIEANIAQLAGGGLASTGPRPAQVSGCSICRNAPDQLDGPIDDLGENEICEDRPCPGDLNGDGMVDGPDLGLLFATWGPCAGGDCPADLNGDGTVEGPDLGLLFSLWGPCP